MATIQNVSRSTFQIGELARRTALSIDAIRFCQRRKLLPPASRTAGRFRLYTANDIERLYFVRRMQRLGFSFEEIKELTGIRAEKHMHCICASILEHKISRRYGKNPRTSAT